MGRLIDTVRMKWHTASMLLKIIYINIAIFLLLRISALVCFFINIPDDSITHFVEMPSLPSLLIRMPWTVITYMFSQFDILHILFNMLWLYWFGTIFLLTDTPKRLVALYLYGGLAGAAAFIIGYNILPVFAGHIGLLIGSSAAVIAIVVATAIVHPDYKISLLFFGSVSLKWIAIITICIFVLSLSGDNAGGHIAHLGGAVIGVCYGIAMNRGKDLTKPLNDLLDLIVDTFRRITAPRQKIKNIKQQNQKASSTKSQQPLSDEDQATLDAILDKIKKSGYTALSAEEKKRLFDVSQHIK